jgi:hypothetical protein
MVRIAATTEREELVFKTHEAVIIEQQRLDNEKKHLEQKLWQEVLYELKTEFEQIFLCEVPWESICLLANHNQLIGECRDMMIERPLLIRYFSKSV